MVLQDGYSSLSSSDNLGEGEWIEGEFRGKGIGIWWMGISHPRFEPPQRSIYPVPADPLSILDDEKSLGKSIGEHPYKNLGVSS